MSSSRPFTDFDLDESILKISTIDDCIACCFEDELLLLIIGLFVSLLDQLVHIIRVQLDLVDLAVDYNALVNYGLPFLFKLGVGEGWNQVEDVRGLFGADEDVAHDGGCDEPHELLLVAHFVDPGHPQDSGSPKQEESDWDQSICPHDLD